MEALPAALSRSELAFVKLGKTQARLGFFPMHPRAGFALFWHHAREDRRARRSERPGGQPVGFGRIQNQQNKMKDTVQPESNAAEQSGRREPISSALPVNPIVAVATAPVGPTQNPSRRPPAPARIVLESCSNRPRLHLESAPGEHPRNLPMLGLGRSATINLGGHSHG